MYKSLLPELKPLIFEGKSGVLHINHQEKDHARLYLKEGLIEQVETNNLQGTKAVDTCLKWVSIEIHFEEGETNDYYPDDKIDTNSILSYLEKAHHNVRVIKQYLENNDAVLQIDTDKLSSAKGLNQESLKTALYLNGQSSLQNVIDQTGQPERTILIHACRLLNSNCARIIPNKKTLPKEVRIEFLRALNDKVMELVGPVGPILIDDAMAAIDTEPYSLTQEELPLIIAEIVSNMDISEGDELTIWSNNYLEDTP